MEAQQADTGFAVFGSYFADNGDAPNTWEGALRVLGDVLIARGCAAPAYIEAAVERERSYPTGLALGTWGVALPHGDPTGVRCGAISVGRFERPVRFRRMDDAESAVDVDVVFFMAVDDPEGHLAVLSKLMDAIGDEACRRELLAAHDGPAIVATIMRYLDHS